MCFFKKYTYQDFSRNDWSGGTSTQLVIYPSESDLLKQNFEFRISTASIDVEESQFTQFFLHKRIICSLLNPITLIHSDIQPFCLTPLVPYSFDGGMTTKCVGKTIDFNVIFNDSWDASIKVYQIDSMIDMAYIQSYSDLTYFFQVQGESFINAILLEESELLLFKEIPDDFNLKIVNKDSLLVCIKLKNIIN
jgi:environmental stress-induced protein Ves